VNPGIGRTRTAADGPRRLEIARRYWGMAEIIDLDQADPAARAVAVGLAVLTGIAASDSACIFRLGRYSRGQDHAEAASLIATIVPGGEAAAKNLRSLTSLKDKAHYGFGDLGVDETKRALRAAISLIEFAQGLFR